MRLCGKNSFLLHQIFRSVKEIITKDYQNGLIEIKCKKKKNLTHNITHNRQSMFSVLNIKESR